jgi:ketosteroid isomerase-like protein
MAEHPNAERIRRAFDAFAPGDMATMTELIAEDTIWHIPGRGPLSGDHQGRETVFDCSVGWCRGRRNLYPAAA